ncbi:MAG TPA: sulfatase [Thermoguttaceae bacterium]|nr:sulfatase [Thermoguttaceae bacterium]
MLILADDLGWADLGCYGNTYHQTPSLDRLAAQGMRFTDAYAASSVCSPTRSSIMSGKYPARNDLTIWLGGHSPANARLLDPPFATELALEEVTIAEALQAAGYATASVGKWHLGGEPFYPEHQGFDLNVAGTSAGSPAGGYFLPNKMNLPGAKQGEYLTDRLTDEALGFIDAHPREPFFLYLPYHVVHTPIQGKKELIALYEKRMKPGQKNTNAAYAAMVHTLDENVGRITAKLDELRLADRTAVFFFSDNGGYHRVTSNAPLRAGKGYSYEGGHREPLIVRLPGRVEAGSVCSTPVVSVDFYPTILELAGAPGDPRHNAALDGVSIVPLLDGTGVPQRDAIYWHYPHYSPQGGTPSGAIRLGDFKLIEFFEDGHLDLYNLAEDIGEATDLVDAMPEMAQRLHGMLVAWRKRVDAKMPSPNPNAGKKPPPRRVPEVVPTREFPGFDVLTDVALTRSGEGYLVASSSTGLALIEPDEPLGPTATFRLRLTPRAQFPANGFLAFGDTPNDEELVKCGLFIGGNYAAIYEGPYPSDDVAKLAMPLRSEGAYDLTVRVDLAGGTVEMSVGHHRVAKKLSRKIDAIRCYGYAVITTKSEFTAIEATPFSPR